MAGSLILEDGSPGQLEQKIKILSSKITRTKRAEGMA
jgi:hypothetical protein